MRFDFTAPLWRWKGDSAWHFVAVPEDAADEIEDLHGGGPGFGAVRVEAEVGSTTWSTSLFPDSARGTYVLPVKKQVRDREGLVEGDDVHVRLSVADPGV